LFSRGNERSEAIGAEAPRQNPPLSAKTKILSAESRWDFRFVLFTIHYSLLIIHSTGFSMNIE
jgi:hypothetical protein